MLWNDLKLLVFPFPRKIIWFGTRPESTEHSNKKTLYLKIKPNNHKRGVGKIVRFPKFLPCLTLTLQYCTFIPIRKEDSKPKTQETKCKNPSCTHFLHPTYTNNPPPHRTTLYFIRFKIPPSIYLAPKRPHRIWHGETRSKRESTPKKPDSMGDGWWTNEQKKTSVWQTLNQITRILRVIFVFYTSYILFIIF